MKKDLETEREATNMNIERNTTVKRFRIRKHLLMYIAGAFPVVGVFIAGSSLAYYVLEDAETEHEQQMKADSFDLFLYGVVTSILWGLVWVFRYGY